MHVDRPVNAGSEAWHHRVFMLKHWNNSQSVSIPRLAIDDLSLITGVVSSIVGIVHAMCAHAVTGVVNSIVGIVLARCAHADTCLFVQADLDLTHEQKLGIIMARDEYLKVLNLLQIKQVPQTKTKPIQIGSILFGSIQFNSTQRPLSSVRQLLGG